jgi:hypothetical protein
MIQVLMCDKNFTHIIHVIVAELLQKLDKVMEWMKQVI